MSDLTCDDDLEMAIGEILKPAIDFSADLNQGETLTGTPVVTIAQDNTTSTAPVVSNPTISGTQVKFEIDATSAGLGDFKIKVLCATSDSPVMRAAFCNVRVLDR
jgi:hypothetical protein